MKTYVMKINENQIKPTDLHPEGFSETPGFDLRFHDKSIPVTRIAIKSDNENAVLILYTDDVSHNCLAYSLVRVDEGE